MATAITIELTTLYDKAVEFASFEAGRGVQDDSLYPTIMVTSRDLPFIRSYAEQALTSMGALLKFCLEDYEISDGDKYVYTFQDTCTLAYKGNTTRHLQEAMTSFIMSQWLVNKLPDRAKTYSTIYTDMMGLLVGSAKRVNPQKPT